MCREVPFKYSLSTPLKGSEWSVVAVPGLVKNNFPVRSKRSDLWTENSGALPIALRGDRDQLRDFFIPGANGSGAAPIYSETKKALDRQSEYWEERRIEEEYRLAYVAFTRAKEVLLATASWFGNGENALDPSPFFDWANEISAAQKARAAQSNNLDDFLLTLDKPDYKNPESQTPPQKVWPAPSPRTDLIRKSAELVLTATPLDLTSPIDSTAPVDSTAPLARTKALALDSHESELLSDAQALIAEIAARRQALTVELPKRLSVSTLITS